MNNKKVALIVIGTNSYFPLAVRLISRIKYFYKGESNLFFHFISNQDPIGFLNLDNVIFHKTDTDMWYESASLKLDMCKKIATEYDYSYIGCIDADSNIFRDFTDNEIFDETFVVEHIENNNGDNSFHYEKNTLSSAYVDPKDYQKIYFQTCYFGGTKEKMIEMVDFAIHLRSLDIDEKSRPLYPDEAYLQIYFMNNPPSQIFNPHTQEHFPFFIDDKGNGREKFTSGRLKKPFYSLSNEEYSSILKNIAILNKQNVLWNITNNTVIIEKNINSL